MKKRKPQKFGREQQSPRSHLMNNCDPTTYIAVDYSNAYSQTTTPTTTTDEYRKFGREQQSPRSSQRRQFHQLYEEVEDKCFFNYTIEKFDKISDDYFLFIFLTPSSSHPYKRENKPDNEDEDAV